MIRRVRIKEMEGQKKAVCIATNRRMGFFCSGRLAKVDWRAAMALKECKGTTRSSWSAVVTRMAGRGPLGGARAWW